MRNRSRTGVCLEVTGPFGKVFGFVTNEFNIAGILSPLVFGALLDNGAPRTMFLVVTAFALLAILVVVSVPQRRAP